MFQELSSFLFDTIYYSWSTIKGSRLLKKIYNFWFRKLFEYVNNIWCFHMEQDDQADDSLKKDELHCKN